MLTNLDAGVILTENVNWAFPVMRFTIHIGLKRTIFELHHGRKPKTGLTNVVQEGTIYTSGWEEKSILASNKPKVPI